MAWERQEDLPPEEGSAINNVRRWLEAASVPPVGPHDKRFADLAALASNWDSYGAPEIDKAALQRARDWLSGVCIVPCSDGGVQLEWHRDGVEFEIVFSADGKIDVLFATENAQRTAVRHVEVPDFHGTWAEYQRLKASGDRAPSEDRVTAAMEAAYLARWGHRLDWGKVDTAYQRELRGQMVAALRAADDVARRAGGPPATPNPDVVEPPNA